MRAAASPRPAGLLAAPRHFIFSPQPKTRSMHAEFTPNIFGALEVVVADAAGSRPCSPPGAPRWPTRNLFAYTTAALSFSAQRKRKVQRVQPARFKNEAK